MQTVGPSIPAVIGSHLDAEALYRAHSEFVARFLLKLGASGQDVPDLLQEVFLVAHRRGGFIMGPAKPTTWLAEIAFRVASDRRKKTKRKPEDADTDAIALLPAASATPGEAAEARQGLARVQRALDSLTSDKRVVFVLFELEGESCDAIAKGLGIPVGRCIRGCTRRVGSSRACISSLRRSRRSTRPSMRAARRSQEQAHE